MQDKPDFYYSQSAVIPYYIEDGTCKVIMVTTRKKKKWTIPKGIIEPDLYPAASAGKEAEEEAGIRGKIGEEVFDTFTYEKWGGTCYVKVYLMEVTEIMDEWEESYFRKRQFFSPEEAVDVIGRKEIRPVLEKFMSKLREG